MHAGRIAADLLEAHHKNYFRRTPAFAHDHCGRMGAGTGRLPCISQLADEPTGALLRIPPTLQELRRDHKVGDFLVVAPSGSGTFYINSQDGKTPYGDFFLREFMPFIERTYRIRPERSKRGITGFSMGGYGALRTGFAHPELFGSVSAHSAAIMQSPPLGLNAGAAAGNPAAQLLSSVFGDPINAKFWELNSPFALARKNAALLRKTKIYFDCGTSDSYGFYRGAGELDQTLGSLMLAHEFHLYPGGHSVSYLLAHREASFEFHWRAFQ